MFRVYGEPFHPASHDALGDAKRPGGLGHVAARGFERVEYQLAFEVVEGFLESAGVRGAAGLGGLERRREVVAVDDVESLDDAAQVDLFALYNRQRESGGMLLVSGADSPQNLHLRDDLRTRLGWGLVYQVHGLSDEEKAQALEQHAQEKGFALPPEVTQYLLRHGRRDLPSLMAALDALDEHSLRMKRAPSVPLLKEVLQQKGN